MWSQVFCINKSLFQENLKNEPLVAQIVCDGVQPDSGCLKDDIL